MAYKNKYKIPYRELKTNVLWEAYILERDYTGSLTTLKGSNRPVIIEYRPENDNDYDWIRPSVCTLSMISESDMRFIEFFTSDDRKYKVRVYRNSVLMWAGYVIPETYKEPYGDVNYEVSISATDGILSLKDISWEPLNEMELASNPYYGMKSLMKLLGTTLGKLDLSELFVWDASYIYESHMNTDDSPFNQTYVNCNLFYDDKGQPIKCYDVLKIVLQAQNCQLWVSDGAFNIVPQNARKASYLRRKYVFSYYNQYGEILPTPVSSETFDPGVVIDDSSYHLYATPTLSFRPAWKKLTVKHDYGFNSNLLYNKLPYFSEFFRGGVTPEGYVINNNQFQGDPNNVKEYEYLSYNLGNVKADAGQRLKVSFLGTGDGNPKIYVYIKGATRDYYLNGGDGEWDENPGIYVYYDVWADSGEWNPVLSDAIPADGILMVKIDAVLLRSRTDQVTCRYKLSDFKIEIVTNQTFYDSKEITTEINDNNFYVPETIELKLGDIPETQEATTATLYHDGYTVIYQKRSSKYQEVINAHLVYAGLLYYYVPAGGSYWGYYELTSLWTVRDRNQYNKLINVIADEIAVNHVDPQWIISGDLLGVMGYGSIIAIGTKKYMILRAEHNQYDCEWNAELFEISDTEQGYLKLRTGGYIKLRTGDKIKVK